jgi:urea transport system permease protein
MGATFIGVVLLFPDGLAGLYERYGKPFVAKLAHRASSKKNEPVPVTAALESGGKHG